MPVNNHLWKCEILKRGTTFATDNQNTPKSVKYIQDFNNCCCGIEHVLFLSYLFLSLSKCIFGWVYLQDDHEQNEGDMG